MKVVDIVSSQSLTNRLDLDIDSDSDKDLDLGEPQEPQGSSKADRVQESFVNSTDHGLPTLAKTSSSTSMLS